MPRNVEIKARVSSLEQVKEIASQLSTTVVEVLKQKDTFFNADNGRLKLRQFIGDKSNPEAQLIFYRRTDQKGPKMSDYSITPSSYPQELERTLKQALGI